MFRVSAVYEAGLCGVLHVGATSGRHCDPSTAGVTAPCSSTSRRTSAPAGDEVIGRGGAGRVRRGVLVTLEGQQRVQHFKIHLIFMMNFYAHLPLSRWREAYDLLVAGKGVAKTADHATPSLLPMYPLTSSLPPPAYTPRGHSGKISHIRSSPHWYESVAKR
ncbi:hypothetical protein E2C01_042527 [Portunus trituberculatus]|uniref:Uncharacterized protein n=1 Tax=Portunus trituberculatus TaxID=210409 RepID=A0A5B7FWR0_PORTR|nr:hypothetical protein [Portunus trituberculatus]